MSVATVAELDISAVASGGEVATGLNGLSIRRRCHNVAEGRKQWESMVFVSKVVVHDRG
jgi:hypothetical protein